MHHLSNLREISKLCGLYPFPSSESLKWIRFCLPLYIEYSIFFALKNFVFSLICQ